MNTETKQFIDDLVKNNNCVLFMKGTPSHPQCGFSSNTVSILKDVLNDDFVTFNVLDNPEVREGIKEYGNWPTIPQLYLGSELVGGNDIITEMFNTGELHSLLELPQPDRTPAKIVITDSAKENIEAGLTDIGTNVLKLTIDSQFNTRFSIEAAKGYEVVSEINGIKIYMDVGTVKRAQGIEIDWVEDLSGSGLVINNPNAPKPIKQITSEELKKAIGENTIQHVFDVRNEEQFSQQNIPNSRRLSKEVMQEIEEMDKSTPIVFVCNVGKSSQGACEFYRKKGFTQVYNLTGGISHWFSS